MGVSQETKEAIADGIVRAIQRGAKMRSDALGEPVTHFRFDCIGTTSMGIDYANDPLNSPYHSKDEAWIAL